jgi:hypothetical protein
MLGVRHVRQRPGTTARPDLPVGMSTREAPIREPIRDDVRRRVLAMLERIKAREVTDDLATREDLARGAARAAAEKKKSTKLRRQSM